jgi:hypothetical protein
MTIQITIKNYLKGLEKGNYDNIIKLFTDKAVVYSPLYGKMSAKKFYKDLFSVTNKSKITLLNILKSVNNKDIGAGHFRYDWVLKDKTPTSFECVDIFKFDNTHKRIKELTIIYDTSKARPKWEKVK